MFFKPNVEDENMGLEYKFSCTSPLEKAFEKMLLLRKTESLIESLLESGKIYGPCHLGLGQEAVSVGVIDCLQNEDAVFAGHRGHNAYIAKTNDIFGLLSELGRKASGCSRGYGGSTFLTNKARGFWGTMPILSGPIGAAAGVSFGSKLIGRGQITVVFIGDSLAEQGIFHEVLNFSSLYRLPILFVCEKNGYSCNVKINDRQPARSIVDLAEAQKIPAISTDGNNYFEVVKATDRLLEICRSDDGPVFLEAKTFRQSSHTGFVRSKDIGVERDCDEIKYWNARDPIVQFKKVNCFNDLHYWENLEVKLTYKISNFLDRTWKAVESKSEVDPKEFYGKSLSDKVELSSIENIKFRPEVFGNLDKKNHTYLEVLQDAIQEIIQADPKVLIIGQGQSSPWDSGKWVAKFFKEFDGRQIFETPVSEAATTAVGIGLAIYGLRAIVTHPRFDFMLLAMDQIVNQAAKIHFMSGGKIRVPLVVRVQLYRGNGQGAQHSQSLHSMFSHVPGLKVFMPAVPTDVSTLLKIAVYSDDPVLFIDDKWLHDWNNFMPDQTDIDPINPGPRCICEGTDITIVGIGYTTRLCYEAALELKAMGIQAEVFDLRVLNPLDCQLIVESVKVTGKILVVDMAWRNCGVAGEVLAQVFEHMSSIQKPCFYSRRLTLPSTGAPASGVQESDFYFDRKVILEEVMKGF